MLHRTNVVGLAALLAVTVGTSGCGPKPTLGVTVTGTMVRDGQPLVVAGSETATGWVEVEFVSLDGKPTEYGWVGENGEFRLTGEGNGIAPGRYKMAVYVRSQGPESDELLGEFAREKTTLEFTIDEAHVGGEQSVGEVDLSAS